MSVFAGYPVTIRHITGVLRIKCYHNTPIYECFTTYFVKIFPILRHFRLTGYPVRVDNYYKMSGC